MMRMTYAATAPTDPSLPPFVCCRHHGHPSGSGNRMPKLLTRDQFRERALARDNNKCVICGGDATEVHHIIERRLFEGGGYGNCRSKLKRKRGVESYEQLAMKEGRGGIIRAIGYEGREGWNHTSNRL